MNPDDLLRLLPARPGAKPSVTAQGSVVTCSYDSAAAFAPRASADHAAIEKAFAILSAEQSEDVQRDDKGAVRRDAKGEPVLAVRVAYRLAPLPSK